MPVAGSGDILETPGPEATEEDMSRQFFVIEANVTDRVLKNGFLQQISLALDSTLPELAARQRT